ncbi:glycoside hydrolase family 2 protein [Amycolatopsis jejuensis]|uniref:glycoside hydrolase family 2 protein n=1 Tax=Amycolatopsis jejuensis TaxID=330084 RepID=UPI000526D17D|nr:glycoside hydrolase family 2 TIM barrel-domain containing protein [Amycolatopsis jejuensis]
MQDRPGERVHPRRSFLLGAGAVVAGSGALSAALSRSAPSVARDGFGADWLFGPFVPGCTDPEFDDTSLALVSVPHCVVPLSWQDWDPAAWQHLWVYRQHFLAPAELRRNRVFLQFDGVLSAATVYLNGRRVATRSGGYLPLRCEITGILTDHDNVLVVVVDGRWQQNTPPDLPEYPNPTAIDFYQPAGLYRAVRLTGAPQTCLSDVYAQQIAVLTPNREVLVHCTVDAAKAVKGAVQLTATLSQDGTEIASSHTDITGLPKGTTTATVSLQGLGAARLWDVDDPVLSDILVTLSIGGRKVHTYPVRTGLRDARFTVDGFRLNGRPLKLFGLNRHQWYPFVGGAMPDRVQRRDAQLLKELNCTMVRCSHYPQATAFLDACDELGLLVWEELPGWDHVGDSAWQELAVRDVHDMIVRDRNHPSIIVWGTRVNETLGQYALYGRTDQLAAELDPMRPCTGAVAGERGYVSPLYPVKAAGGVFSFNDYSRPHPPGSPPPLRPPRHGVPYLVSEAVGTLVGSPYFRRTDSLAVQREQGMLHAWVHDHAAADPRYCGLIGWCGFDYPSGWYHNYRGVKYPGVVDFFRIPKLGAGFYRAQRDPARGAVIEPAFYWDFGPGSPPNGPGRDAIVWSNCDVLVVTVAGRRPVTIRPDRERFPHLAHPPFTVDLRVHGRPELTIEGQVGGHTVLRRRFSADPAYDTLSVTADDGEITADGEDTTRVAMRSLDRYGAPRPHPRGILAVTVDGPGVLIGDPYLDFAALGGAAAVWIRSMRGNPGVVTVTATHPFLDSGTATIASV